MKEIEAKFQVAGEQLPIDLITAMELPGNLELENVGPVQVKDIYLDTPDLCLARHGHVIRIRRKNGQQLITLKSFSGDRDFGIQDRLEIERPLENGSEPFSVDAWPREVNEIAASIVGLDAVWQPICTIRQDREKYIIHLRNEPEATPAPLAELSIDSVDVFGPGVDSRQVQTHFGEIEVELMAADLEQELEVLVTWFAEQDGLEPIGGNKLMRSLRAIAGTPLAGSAQQSGIQRTMTTADACRLIWRQEMTEMILTEAGVRADRDIEFVHGMRVATRRARAASVLFGDFFEKEEIRSHRQLFKQTAKRLGPVRDLDVALARLAKYCRRLPEDQRTQFEVLAIHWRQERNEPLAALIDWLDSDTYASSIVDLGAFCTTPGQGAKPNKSLRGEVPAADAVHYVLPSRIYARFEAVRRYETAFEQEGLPSLAVLHALRIDCKYLRYVLEFSRHFLGEDRTDLIAQLKHLQNRLGEINDADVTRRMLQDLPSALQGGAVDAYVMHQNEIIDDRRQQVGLALGVFVAPANRQRIAGAIANI